MHELVVISVLGNFEVEDIPVADIDEVDVEVVPRFIPPDMPLARLNEGARANLGTLNQEFRLLPEDS